MDQLPSRYEPSHLTPHVPPEFCPYCGAALHPLLYFCPGCATPYKSPETVITPYIPRQLTDEELVARDAPHVMKIFWTYLSVLVAVGLYSILTLDENRFDLHLLFNDVAIFFTTCVVGFIYRQSLAAQMKQFGFFKAEAWAGILMLAACLLVNYLYHVVFIRSLLPHRPTHEFDRLREAVGNEWILVFSFCVFPAITEEIAYRGLVQHWLQAAIVPWKAIVFASFLFAATHLSAVSFPYLFLVGMLLGWTKWKTGSLYPSMLIHFLHNLAVIEFFPTGE